MWQRIRDEEQRLEILELDRLNSTQPWARKILALPMTEDMEIQCRRYTKGLQRGDRLRRKNKRSRFTSAKEQPEESKIEEIVNEPPRPPKRKMNLLLDGCRSIEEYEPLNKIDEGSYGIVFRAREKATGEIYAIKKVKLEREKEGFPITALREITLLMKLEHPNIVKVKEVVFGSSLDKVYVVMEYIDHEIKSLVQQSFEALSVPRTEEEMKREIYCLSTVEIKCILKQLLKGVQFMHDHWIIHRDLKTSNLLINNNGVLKI